MSDCYTIWIFAAENRKLRGILDLEFIDTQQKKISAKSFTFS